MAKSLDTVWISKVNSHSGFVACSIHGEKAVQGKEAWGFFCPVAECTYSELSLN